MKGKLIEKEGRIRLVVDSDRNKAEFELVSILLDLRNSISLRDDAAMDLSEYSSDLSLCALAYVAINEPNLTVRESAAYSFGETLAKLSMVTFEQYVEMALSFRGVARLEFETALALHNSSYSSLFQELN